MPLSSPPQQRHYHADNDAGAETNRQRLGRSPPHYGRDVGRLFGRFLGGISRRLGIGPSRHSRPSKCGGTIQGELLEKLLDDFWHLTRFSLDYGD